MWWQLRFGLHVQLVRFILRVAENGVWGQVRQPLFSFFRQFEYGEGNDSAMKATTISTAKVGDLGTILVDSGGLTVYYFKKDENGKSACYGACAEAWPPVSTEGNPVAKGGAMDGKLGTVKRKDGSTQVTYAGWPLYLYAGDSKPGQANGNDIEQFGAEWYALTPSGEKPEDS